VNPHESTKSRFALLTLGALGVVYGDIGTSPLYALKECFLKDYGVAVERTNVLGILSLVTWALILIVSIKYIVFVMRADNRGEGGIIALMSLAFPERKERASKAKLAAFMVGLGIFGAALLYGDGMITPAVSVLGAVEGLDVATPALQPYIVPISVVILLALFSCQHHGTGTVGRVFGPVMVLWFLVIALLGVRGILTDPGVLISLSPVPAIAFLATHGWIGFKVLGAVFLAVTGGEALYADMGHFGARPIRTAWFVMVLPCLLLNYYGQGALIIGNPLDADNPFFKLCPRWGLYPCVGLAAAAAVIASQALISGVFSLTMQAIQFGYLPRMTIEHTSETERGQIYMPQVNWTLAVACILLVLGFKTSSNLAAAYGIAVTLTMLATTALFYFAAHRLWHWPAFLTLAICGVFGSVEAAFFAANALKVFNGGWYPLLVGALLFSVMTTWKTGRKLLWQRVRDAALPLDMFMESLKRREPNRVKGVAVFLASNADSTPLALLHNLKHNKVLHERVVFLTLNFEEQPHVDPGNRVALEGLGQGVWRLRASFGFMDDPNVMEVLREAAAKGLEVAPNEATYFLSRETVVPSRNPGMARWREHLFSLMSRNAQSATTFFRIPANRVVELGMQVEI
jgi:KUP system potassium uptake protein